MERARKIAHRKSLLLNVDDEETSQGLTFVTSNINTGQAPIYLPLPTNLDLHNDKNLVP